MLHGVSLFRAARPLCWITALESVVPARKWLFPEISKRLASKVDRPTAPQSPAFAGIFTCAGLGAIAIEHIAAVEFPLPDLGGDALAARRQLVLGRWVAALR